MQAAWALLLAHYTELSDVVFGAAFSGRPDQLDGIETLIGPCVTNVPVRAKFGFGEPLQTLADAPPSATARSQPASVHVRST